MLKHIGPVTGPGSVRPNERPDEKRPDAQRPEVSFGDILARENARRVRGGGPVSEPGATGNPAQRTPDVRLSAHARERLESRQITLTDQHHARLDEAVARADEKGANQSLVLLDDLALVVSVRNRVVITALDEEKAKSGVFTNIDSAVIA